MARMYVREPVQDRLERHSVAIPFAGCIVWTGAVDKLGYGRIGMQGKSKLAHRISYQHYVGEIPVGLELDHLCRNPSCINPNHLEPVTRKVNTDRGLCAETHRKRFAAMTHCKRGHEFTVENTYFHPTHNRRQCKICGIEASKRFKEKSCGK
jgi:hypothetical protein